MLPKEVPILPDGYSLAAAIGTFGSADRYTRRHTDPKRSTVLRRVGEGVIQTISDQRAETPTA
jgi:hypothetical protein